MQLLFKPVVFFFDFHVVLDFLVLVRVARVHFVFAPQIRDLDFERTLFVRKRPQRAHQLLQLVLPLGQGGLDLLELAAQLVGFAHGLL